MEASGCFGFLFFNKVEKIQEKRSVTWTHFERHLFQSYTQTINKVANAFEVILQADIGNSVLAL